MKAELLKKINPIIEKCIDEVLASFNDIEKIRESSIDDKNTFEYLCNQKNVELVEIKNQKSQNKEEFDRKISELEIEKENHILSMKNYQQLIKEISTKEKQIDEKLSKIKIELMCANDTRTEADKKLQAAENLRKTYEQKIDILKIDNERMLSREKELNLRQEKICIRENEISVREIRNAQMSKDLSDVTLKIKFERKEIDRLVSRYQLEQEVKNG